MVKFNDGFRFSNPGSLKLPKEQIYKGGESKARNPHMQTMLRMVGFGDNAGSGFPDILKIWSDNGWEIPELMEDTILNQVTLILKYKTDEVGESIFLDAKMSEDEKNERRLSEALSEVMTASDYKKVEEIILYLEDNKYITPQLAEKLTGKSAPTVRRYLKMLVETGYVKVDGSTSNIRYVI
ncbi:ATP-binding protein [Ruminococcus sp. 2227st1_E6_2227SCRN_220401]|uniref:ATP-binding protein n=1 Tax=unclassified Ruminococcus TaxID=2608920 RepID=UPI00319E234C